MFALFPLLTPIIVARTPDDNLRFVIQHKAPKLVEIFQRESSIFGYEKLNCSENIWLLIFLFELFFIITFAIIIIIGLNIFLYYLIKIRSTKKNSKVIKLQIMLYRTLTAQLVSVLSSD